MSWAAVAKKDFRDASHSRALWALLGVFVVVLTLTSYSYVELPAMLGGTEEASIGGLLFFTAGNAALFVALTAIVICYKSIAGERELGSIKLLLALPHTRRDVLVGKVLGRTAVLVAALAIGLAAGLGFGLALLGTVELVPVATFVLVTLLFAAVYVSIVVAISATTGSTSRATTFALGFFVAFELLWDVVPMAVVYAANGFSLPARMPDWTFLVSQISPSSAYITALAAALPDLASTTGAAMGAGEIDAFYADPAVGFAVLAFWLVVPLTIGYRRFAAADL
ncbi:ABC transporter permease subunit [Salinilacihabitans rarus]|uniref:ABC transporter permease subunit n=1 Tax=Salinilacihabitans rarus TaxID=2961596 RepID=UPI0020C8C44A|nr:ABC transporter permease subunit [Salinilacihabitans rarus]